MNKQQYNQLLKTMKPMHRTPTVFGLSLREFILALIAAGAVLVAVFR